MCVPVSGKAASACPWLGWSTSTVQRVCVGLPSSIFIFLVVDPQTLALTWMAESSNNALREVRREASY